MSNEKSYNKITISIATALMIVLTVSVGFQLAPPAMAQNMTQEAGQAVDNATGGNQTGNQTGNQSGNPLEQLGQMLGFGGN
ncbi:MAG: hypothetical protein ACRD8Z_26480 [Nitrososphaeraceae archaeon]